MGHILHPVMDLQQFFDETVQIYNESCREEYIGNRNPRIIFELNNHLEGICTTLRIMISNATTEYLQMLLVCLYSLMYNKLLQINELQENIAEGFFFIF